MNRQKKSSLLLILLPLIISCTPPNNTLITASPTANPSVKPTQASASPSIQPTVSATPTPLQTATPTPVPTPTSSTTDISEFATVNGKVYDEAGNLLNDIKVSIKSLEPNVPFSGEILTSNGTYVFRNVPVGIRLEITAFKSNKWTTRVQSYVSKSNLSGDSTANVINFGDDLLIGSINKTNFNFLTDAPEVVSITPGRDNVIPHDNFSFKLKFSEPISKQSIEENLVVRYVREDFPISTIIGDGNDGTTNTDGPPSIKGNRQVIIDKYTIGRKYLWDTVDSDSYGKELTFSLDNTRGVVTNNNARTRYGISLRGKTGNVQIRDVDNNIGLLDGEFFVDNKRAKNVILSVDADRTQPYLESVKLFKINNNCIIRLNFSEPMSVEGFTNLDLQDLSFYKFYKNSDSITLTNPVIDVQNPRSIEFKTDLNTFQISDKIKVEVDPNLKDPAGNFFSQGVTLGELDNVKEVRFDP